MPADAGPSDEEMAVMSAAVSAAADRTVPLAEALEPEHFFQAAVSETCRALILAFVGEPSPSVRQQLEEAARPIHVEFRRVNHGLAKLQRLSDRVHRDMALWATRGAELSSWGPTWTSNKVSIGLVKYDPDVARLIEAHYGADLVEVEPRDVPYMDLF